MGAEVPLGTVPASSDHLERNLTRGERATWWCRRGSKARGFRYETAEGHAVVDAAIQRIQDLSIPPAWTQVRIAPSPRSRLQALGVDGSGQLQYLYRSSYRAHQERRKFERIEHFGDLLPRLRKETSVDIARPGLPREKVLAVLVRLIHRLYFRVGSEEGVDRHHTFGITTLRKRHLRVDADGGLHFRFRGKHHVAQQRVLVDEGLAAILRSLRALAGSHLFQWVDEGGGVHTIRGRELNDYLKAHSASDYSVKDFRTWHGTLLVAQELGKLGRAETATQRRRNLLKAVRSAAAQLGNTPAVCRRSYLHPSIVFLYERGITLVDVPLSPGRIRAVDDGPVVEEMQLLELFHVARVLRQRRLGRTQVATPDADGLLRLFAPHQMAHAEEHAIAAA
jgi:DNA topoisomerase-1